MILMVEIVHGRIILFQKVTKIGYSSGSGENLSEGTVNSLWNNIGRFLQNKVRNLPFLLMNFSKEF